VTPVVIAHPPSQEADNACGSEPLSPVSDYAESVEPHSRAADNACGSEPQSPGALRRVGIVACGALALHVSEIANRRGWDVAVHPLPPLLHNRPERIADAVERELDRLAGRYDRLAVAYADCGTYGALDDVLGRREVGRLRGDHCYDVFARNEVADALAEEPGTYFLTDFLARTFDHSVVRPLGLDRHPDLRDTYFKNYTRVVWLAQRPRLSLQKAAERAAATLHLPLEIRQVGASGLERQLEALVASATTPPSRQEVA